MQVFRSLECYNYMFSTMDANEDAHLSYCICGYRVCNIFWSATVGEELQCKEVGNA